MGRAYLLFALGAALLVGLGLAGVLGFREFGQAHQQLHTHTFQVLDQLSEVRTAMLDVETGARGFVLSGTPE